MFNRRFFLWTGIGLLTTLAGARGAQARSNILIVAVGDSTTAGSPYFRSPLESPPDGVGDPEGQYAYWMMRKRHQWKVLNYGMAGQTSRQIRLRLTDAIKLNPRYIIVLAGVNDIYQGLPLNEISDNLLTMYREIKAHGIMPVAATILPFDTATPAQARGIEKVNDWIRKAADHLNFPLADVNTALRDPQNHNRLGGSPDGIHPDVGGYRKMGLTFIDVIDPIEKVWR